MKLAHTAMAAGLLFSAGLALAASPAPGNAKNEAAVREVLAGKRTEANAAWWGFDPDDSTAALQAAIDSRARKLVVPFMGRPWIARPLRLRSNQEITLEPGVVVLARKGEFRGHGDSLFTATGESNITILGYGATLRMRKRDYQNPPYEKAEWRMGIALHGCRNVRIDGLRVESTGGDGFYVDGGAGRPASEDIVIRNCVAHDNHRQGISVISAVNLLVENCFFSGTSGTAPEAGIDLEPDTPEQRLVNCVIRNCRFENNHGHQILVYLKQLQRSSEPVSIRFENCYSRMTGEAGGGWAGMAVGAVRDDGPKGLIEFRNCTTEDTGREGAVVYDKSADGALVRFVNCSWKKPWNASAADYGGPRVPVLIRLRHPEITKKYGGVEFADCYVYDDVNRPALQAEEDQTQLGVHDLHGRMVVENPAGARFKLGPNRDHADVELVPAGPGTNRHAQ
ncbi:MAG TPA: right-handed parallel beta-helix repeat-containing protein [Bryobacteraceae bacterium]|nr:right-handed parallel beta-helix repeat-containing protein [Bryobacteraceae bacterium]